MSTYEGVERSGHIAMALLFLAWSAGATEKSMCVNSPSPGPIYTSESNDALASREVVGVAPNLETTLVNTGIYMRSIPALGRQVGVINNLLDSGPDLPNLTPYQPAGWSDKIIISRTTETTVDSTTLTTGDILYLDWAVLNTGSVAAGAFSIQLYVDDVAVKAWNSSTLATNFYTYAKDYYLGILTAGTHTLRIKADSESTVAESDETDNEYTKTIIVTGPDLPNLTPYKPSTWSDKIVVAGTTGTTTNSSYYTTNDTLYVDWSVINQGAIAAPAGYITRLFVDDVPTYYWTRSGNLDPGYYVYVLDQSIGKLPAGTHTVRIAADATTVVTEINEGDNEYTKTILVYTDPSISVQPVGQTLLPGGTANFAVSAVGTQPLNYQWRKNGGDLAGATMSSLVITNVQTTDDGSAYSVVVSNAIGAVTSQNAVLCVDTNGVDAFNPGASDIVRSMAVQADGKILAGGAFTTIAGQARSRIARLNPDGTLDSEFNPGADSTVYSFAVQDDGKILVGGWFTSLAGQPRNYIGRLNGDGALDTSFNPDANNYVRSATVKADGKILVAGDFTTIGGQTRNRLAQLNADGTLDVGFDVNANEAARTILVQEDGKILIGGVFTAIGGQVRNRIARLNADGTLDGTFNPNANSYVYCLAIQADGKILAGGAFTTIAGQARNRIARLNADGTLDESFNPGANVDVLTLAIQADGKILVGGDFTTIGGQTRNRIARLNTDGTLDAAFNPGASASVYSLGLQADGKILVGGSFAVVAAQSRSRIARLKNNTIASQELSQTGATLTWLRGGSSPEVSRTAFDCTTNGTDWVFLGAGTRVAGGWSVGVIEGSDLMIRARGYTAGGMYGGSAGIVTAGMGFPAFVLQPASMSRNAGTTAILSVRLLGGAPFSYQWRKNGVSLVDGGTVTGATTDVLTINNLLKADEGGYDLLVSNPWGHVTSQLATLTVADPAVNVQPATQCGQPGDNITLSVTAAGTGNLSYQWRKNGVPLPGASSSMLTITNLQASAEGNYDVVVYGTYGCVTSATAVLTLNLAVADMSFNPNANGIIYSVAEQLDRKILMGGGFTTVGGQTRTNIARLNMDGTLDTNFNPNASSIVNVLTMQADKKILVGGWFTNITGQVRNRIVRLNEDGTLDADFNASADNVIMSLVVLANGKILVSGGFYMFSGQYRWRIALLNEDGTLDTNFNPPSSNGTCYSPVVQADGKVLIGGSFTTLGGQTRNNIARLNTDGTLDINFNPNANGYVNALMMQADGKILVGGNFTSIAGQARNYLARLNADGTLDTNFNPHVDGYVFSIVLQADGSVLLAGAFTSVDGQARNRIARLNMDGTLEGSFNPGANNTVYALAVAADGNIVMGGSFTNVAGQARDRIARLHNTGAATQRLIHDDSTITWLRGGTSPEVGFTTFDSSADGVVWTRLGAGTRTVGGWRLTGLSSLSTNTKVRARGYVTGGEYNGSGWFVETIATQSLYRLQILSAHGTSSPAPGWYTNACGTALVNSVSIADTQGSTQYVCTGWTMTGCAPIAGLTNVMVMTHTNDAVLTWQWKTQYNLMASALPNGSVVASNGWYDANSVATALAVAGNGYHFVGWSGDVEGLDTNANPITLPMGQARSLMANFAINFYAITASAGPKGNIAPNGVVEVAYGGSTSFVVAADAYYHIANLSTNGTDVAAAAGKNIYTSIWMNVTGTGLLSATFAENLTANTGTPEWWLAHYGWTNNFTAAATNDTDGDGHAAWQEHIADTDPTNPASFFRIESLNLIPPDWRIYVQSSTGRIYTLYFTGDLSGNVWTNVPGQTGVSGTGGILPLVHTNGTSQGYYRIRVNLPQ